MPDETTDTLSEYRPDKKIFIIVLVLAGVILGGVVGFGIPFLTASGSVPTTPGTTTVWYFYGDGCEHCVYVTPYVQSLQQKYPDIDFRILEVYYNPANRDLLTSMNQNHNQKKTGVPVAFVGDVVLLGGEEIPQNLERVLLTK